MAYMVKKGDTMQKIAGQMNVSLSELIAANPQMQNPDMIQVGDLVNMPGEQGASQSVFSDWCSFVLNIVNNRVPEPGVSLVQFPVRRHVFVGAMGMPAPSTFGPQFNIYTAWIASSLSPLAVKDFFDLSPTVEPGFWSNHKNIPSLATTDYVLVTPETTGHGAQPVNPIVVLQGRLTNCCRR